MTKFVCCVPKELRGRLLDFPRLYAYPTAPEPARDFVILDSGAFEMSMRGKQIDEMHMKKMNDHYQKFGASNDKPVIGVAPDVFLNPAATMKNWQTWNANHYAPVAPVIQFTAMKKIDLYSVMKQVKFYGVHPFAFISNPGLRGAEAWSRSFQHAVNLVRENMKPNWIHILGAGWDRQDVADWKRISGIDSIDTIAYYTAAREGVAWSGVADDDWKVTAINNAVMARDLSNGTMVLST
jgi:hypothetical protein